MTPGSELQHAREVASLERDVLDVVARDQTRARAPLVVWHLTASACTETVSGHAADVERDRAQRAMRSVDASTMPFCS